MEYTKTVWKDLPDTSTPITASRLNNLENGVEYLFQNESSHGINEYSQSTTDSYSCNYVNELIKSSQGYIELGDIQIIYGAVSMTFQPGENYQTIQFEKSFIDNNYVVTLTFQYQASYYTQLGPVVYEKNTTNVKLGAYNSHTGNVPETLGYMIIGKKSTN